MIALRRLMFALAAFMLISLRVDWQDRPLYATSTTTGGIIAAPSTPTPAETSTPTLTPTPTETSTSPFTPTPTPTETSTPIGTPTPTATPTVVPDATATVEPSFFSVSINGGADYTNQNAVILSLTWRFEATQMMVSNDGGFFGAVWEPVVPFRSWMVAPYQAGIVTKIVYVRFGRADGEVLQTLQDDIILDITAPSGSVSAEPLTGGAETLLLVPPSPSLFLYPGQERALYIPKVESRTCDTGEPTVRLHLTAQDDLSGVAEMLISNSPIFGCATWEAFSPSKLWYAPPTAERVYVKFRDKAGNFSPPVTATIPD